MQKKVLSPFFQEGRGHIKMFVSSAIRSLRRLGGYRPEKVFLILSPQAKHKCRKIVTRSCGRIKESNMQPLLPTNCIHLMFCLGQKESPKTSTYSPDTVLPWSLKPTLNLKRRQVPVLLLDYQQDILTFRHLPYTPPGALELHSFGHLEAAYLWLRQKSANTPEDDEFYQIQGAVDAIGIRIRRDINNKLQRQSSCQKWKCKQYLLWLIYQDNFKWDSNFFNMRSGFLWWNIWKG